MLNHRHITTRSLATAGLISAALAAPAPAVVMRDAVDSLPTAPAVVDLRSPDAATPVVLAAARPAIVAPHATPSDEGFDMTSALIGAGIAGLLAMGAGVLVRTRSRHHVAPLGS